MKGLRLIGIALAGVTAAHAVAQDSFPDVAENYPVYRSLAFLKATGIIRSMPDNVTHQRPTYDDAARFAIEAFDNLPGYLNECPVVPRQRIERTAECRQSLRWQIEFWADDIPKHYGALIPRLKEAIRKRGRDPESLLKTFEELHTRIIRDVGVLKKMLAAAGGLPPFADVQSTHWASREVQEMREEGIFVGYPDGKFKGESTEQVRRRASDR